LAPTSKSARQNQHQISNRSPRASGDVLQITESQVVETLSHGKIDEKGLLPYSSNHSFLVTVQDDALTLPAVYKPRHGENPLWDFEWGSLCLREAAAYYVSHYLDWNLVPPTILREGTRGIGSVQLYIANHDEEHYFTVQADARFARTFRRLSLFDFIINNADRKSGHCLVGVDGRIWAIDHGICFHTEYKLRTVIWEYSDEPIEEELMESLVGLCKALEDSASNLSQILCSLLTDSERRCLGRRVEQLVQTRRYPAPLPNRRNYPWPPI
jgi:uncharacterized repeat protein (TIGR03843 family)